MYLISIYFDKTTQKRIGSFMEQLAKASGNYTMLEGSVPPHITIAAFQMKDASEEYVANVFEEAVSSLLQGELTWASAGQFFPGVLFLTPVLNEYLHDMSQCIYNRLIQEEAIQISPYYRPFQWMPHTTIGKMLKPEEMEAGFCMLQKQFGPFKGRAEKIGLAKTNPYTDIIVRELSQDFKI